MGEGTQFLLVQSEMGENIQKCSGYQTTGDIKFLIWSLGDIPTHQGLPPCLINLRLRSVCSRCFWTLAKPLISQYLSLPLQWLVISFLWLLSQMNTNLVADTIKIYFFHNSGSRACIHNILLPPWRKSSRGLDCRLAQELVPDNRKLLTLCPVWLLFPQLKPFPGCQPWESNVLLRSSG